MNILQLSILKNTGCAGGCKFCGLSVESQVNRESILAETDFEYAFEQAKVTNARLEIVFPTVGANQLEVINLLHKMQPIIQKYQDIELSVNPGICTRPDFYSLLVKYGVSRYRNNLECSRRLFRELVPQRPLAQIEKLNSLVFAREAGLKAETGWLCGLGELEADIQDILMLLEVASPDSITLNFFDSRESAEVFEHTAPSPQIGLERMSVLRDRFSSVEITLGGAYELWLGENGKQVSGANGVYVGRFLDHGLHEERITPASGCC
jgi:biotin synthase